MTGVQTCALPILCVWGGRHGGVGRWRDGVGGMRSTELDERLDVKDEEEGRVLTACPRSA